MRGAKPSKLTNRGVKKITKVLKRGVETIKETKTGAETTKVLKRGVKTTKVLKRGKNI